jgi:hypothetical protein
MQEGIRSGVTAGVGHTLVIVAGSAAGMIAAADPGVIAAGVGVAAVEVVMAGIAGSIRRGHQATRRRGVTAAASISVRAAAARTTRRASTAARITRSVGRGAGVEFERLSFGAFVWLAVVDLSWLGVTMDSPMQSFATVYMTDAILPVAAASGIQQLRQPCEWHAC